VGPEGVVLPAPAISQGLASATVVNSSMFRNSSLNIELLIDSAKPFCHGEPSSMYAVVVPLFSL